MSCNGVAMNADGLRKLLDAAGDLGSCPGKVWPNPFATVVDEKDRDKLVEAIMDVYGEEEGGDDAAGGSGAAAPGPAPIKELRLGITDSSIDGDEAPACEAAGTAGALLNAWEQLAQQLASADKSIALHIRQLEQSLEAAIRSQQELTRVTAAPPTGAGGSGAAEAGRPAPADGGGKGT